MTENKPGLLFPTIEFMVLAAIMIAVPVIVGLDVDVFLYGSSEVSATELTQEALILLSAIVSGITAIRHPASRSWLVLVSGFFAGMFLREIDFWLDRVSHGFWVYPTAITGLAAISYSARNRDGFLDAAADYLATRSHAYIAVGLLIVVLFSRLAGASRFWMQVMGNNYHAAYKTFMQEGLELLGYALIALGSMMLYFRQQRR